jgi:hypothetical protein
VNPIPDELFEQVKLFLPKYLTPEESHILFEELRRFPEKQDFYLSAPPEPLLQGDGWRGFVLINFETQEKKSVSGLVLSNSCDIDLSNGRALDTRILFTPLIKLSTYANLLERAGKGAQQTGDTLSAIRTQRITYIFYLPELAGVMPESMVLLDDIHTHPLRDFIERDRSRLFTLSQTGFYMLLLKLSIHFSRFQEGVRRFPPDKPADA